MKKSSEDQQKQKKDIQMEIQFDEGSRSNYNYNQYHQSNLLSSNFHNDHTQNFNKRSLLDFNFNDHLNHVLNNQQNQEANQPQPLHDCESYINKRQIFSQPNNMYANNNIMQFVWTYNCPSQHLENDVKKQDNIYQSQKQYRQWGLPVHFQVKDQPIDEEISNYLIQNYCLQKQDLNSNLPLLKEQNIEYDLKQQNYFENLDQNFVKLEGGLQRQNRQKINIQKSQSKTSNQIRRQKVQLYLKKKKSRNYSKKITYQCRKQVADKRIRLKGRFINYKQAVIQLKLDPNQKYEVSYLKQLIKKMDQSGCMTPASSSQINPQQLQKDERQFPLLIEQCQRQIQKSNLFDQLKD